ncbi:MAG: IS630 family transposase [Plectolyngbya sp. WJT66-NPBG17]|nr:IS630 family transposase [Plectolyngbya sp. WJT66-NPBG17]
MIARLNAPLPLRYWCEDESRMGLKTELGRVITARGVKPIAPVQWVRQAFYLYGIVEPRTGESFFYEFSHLDSVCFERFLKLVSEAYPQSLNVIQTDNASAHTAANIEIPDNVVLVFQPAHSPELNPIEQVWMDIKADLKNEIFGTLDDLRNAITEVLSYLSPDWIASLSGYSYILSALSVAGIH